MKKLPTIFLEQKTYKKTDLLLVKCSYNTTLLNLLRKMPEAIWKVSLKAWCLKNTKENLNLVLTTFKGITDIDSSKLPKKTPFKRKLTEPQKKLLNNFYLYLKGKRYSSSTIQTYTFFVADFINFNTKTELNELTNRHVELFIESVFIERDYSISSQRQFISALKVFDNFYPHTKINDIELARPKKSRKLPSVLSQEEILEIIRCTQNLKHKAILALIYSCGLRISELVNLRLIDFHIERKQLIIKNGKGRKDRYVSLADSFLPLLSNYYHSYKPKNYFVEGLNGGKYSAESVRQFLRKSCKKQMSIKLLLHIH